MFKHCLVVFVIFITQSLLSRPMVYDCFLFFNELEILDIRLHEMDPVVDKFVIVEAVETFRGDLKPLFFKENAERFSKYRDKIIHVVYEKRIETGDPWRREYSQRDYILQALEGCQEDDIILISDVDEIVKRAGVVAMADTLMRGTYEIVGAAQRYHSNMLNSYSGGPLWRGTVATTYARVKEHLPQGLRHRRNWVPAVAEGWHFTWQGGIEPVLYKMRSYAYWESDTPADRERTRKDYETRHLCPVVPIDETFPEYVRENQDYLESIGYIIKPTPENSKVFD